MQTQYNKFVFELGSIEAQLAEINNTKTAIETDKSNILGDIKTLTVKEKELLTILQDKYGMGTINIETGEITPA